MEFDTTLGMSKCSSGGENGCSHTSQHQLAQLTVSHFTVNQLLM